MTTSPTRNGAEALMAIKAISNLAETASQDTEAGVGKVIGKLSGTDIEYWIRKDKVVIGRNSSHGKVDVNIGMTSYVSRKHLQINYERGRFFLVCIGKNGVFVDGLFQRLGASPMPLDRACVIRFPSTSIRLTFNPHPLDFLNGSTNSQPANESIPIQPQTVESKPQLSNLEVPVSLPHHKPLSPITHSEFEARKLKREFSSPSLKYMIPRDPRGFLSAPPSPTGTISAVNSCPSSPRREASQLASQNHNVTEKLTAAASAIANAMQEQNEKGSNTDGMDSKPPYSYAQLIIQAISSAPHRQLTLSGIYAHITKNYPYYRTADKGWQNSIRHNLSLNRYFVKVPRSQEESGKGSFWRVDPASERKLVEQAWRKRRQRAVPCLSTALTAPGSTITRSAPVSPERSNPISPLSAARRAMASSQEEIQHSLQTAENDTKLKLMPLNSRYAQSAPGSPSEYSHAVVMTTMSDAHLMSAISMSQQRASIMTSAGSIPVSDNGLGRVIWPLSSINTQTQGPALQAQVLPSSLSVIKEETSKRLPVSVGTTAPRPVTVKSEPPKVPLVMQPSSISSVNPTAITTLSAQQQQQFLQRQQQQKFQQQVVMVTGQGHQRVPQAIPINIGTIVAGPNTLVNSGIPFVMPTTGNQQYVVKRINEDSTPVSGASPAKKAKTEENITNEP